MEGVEEGGQKGRKATMNETQSADPSASPQAGDGPSCLKVLGYTALCALGAVILFFAVVWLGFVNG